MGPQKKLSDRLRESRFPPAALLGAFTSFIAAILRHQPLSRAESRSAPERVRVDLAPRHLRTPPQARLERAYLKVLVIGSLGAELPFRRSLLGIAVGPGDLVYALGDDEVRIFNSDGTAAGRWKAPAGALCLTVSPDKSVFLGFAGRVELYGSEGNRMGGFAAGESSRPARVTAVRVLGDEIFAADAAAHHIRRYDMAGNQIGTVGTRNKTGGFMLPNRALDMAIGAGRIIHATDPGRHRVTSWTAEGAPLGHFGKFGLLNPEDFVGCCNPVNLAVTPEGNVVTAEKVAARVKVFAPGGRLLALLGPEHFDPKCTHLHLAVDSKGRILVGDPVRLQISVFASGPGGREIA
jgi:hypothetical protein